MDEITASLSQWLDWSHLTASGPAVKPTLPPSSYFTFPPADLPKTLPPPPQANPTNDYPFTIPEDWYNAALSPAVPITFALVYATLITYLNSVNAKRNKKPWAISQTWVFTAFVVVHNIFLSLYSLWTFIGMSRTLRVSIVDPREYGLAATVDSFCKLHGPRGLGSAATYNATSSTWGITDRVYRLGIDELTPDNTDVGRIWNEGLAFYGWLFYISKFYEVVDTLIILAKGKKSSFLQTYHHAGAMLCMWAGMRYMSPPIWMFCYLNSFIHFVMYTFYTAATLKIRVPKRLKKVLTTLQITQFVVGMSFAFLHYFVAYELPISVPYVFHLGGAVKDAATAIKSDASSAVSIATATASADLGSWLKKIALRAAGREGLAENVENELGQTFGIDAVHAAEDLVMREEIRYREELKWVQCIDTSGQSFAIYLNLFYLLPLTWLFLQFFINSYLQRVEARRRSSVGQKAIIAGQSMNAARKSVGRRLSQAFEDYQGANGDVNGDTNDDMVIVDGDEIRRELRELAKQAQEKGHDVSDAISEQAASVDIDGVKQDVQQEVAYLKDQATAELQKAEEYIEQAGPSESTKDDIKEKASEAVTTAKEAVPDLSKDEIGEKLSTTAKQIETQVANVGSSMQETAQNSVSQETKDEVSSTVERVKEEATNATSAVEESVDKSISQETKDTLSETAEQVKNETKEVTAATEESADKALGNAKDETDKVEDSVEGKAETALERSEEVVDHGQEKASEVIENSQEEGTSDTREVQQGEDKDTSGPTHAPVQEGKSFADAAAEGTAEKDEGEVKAAGEEVESEDVKSKDDEGA